MSNFKRPIIAFATSKGGSGKTTQAMLLAGALAEQGAKVGMIDTDPQQSLYGWSHKPGKPDNIEVFSAQDQDTLFDLIEQLQTTHHLTIIDVQGRASELGNAAMAWSKLVIIPVQPSGFDADAAANTIRALATTARAHRIDMNYAVCMNRLSPMVKSRTAMSVVNAFKQNKIPMLNGFMDREAYRILTASGGTVYTLNDKQAPGLDKARAECAIFALQVSEEVGLVDKGKGTPTRSTKPEVLAAALSNAGDMIEQDRTDAIANGEADDRLDDGIIEDLDNRISALDGDGKDEEAAA